MTGDQENVSAPVSQSWLWSLIIKPETEAQKQNRKEQAVLRSKIIVLQKQIYSLNSGIIDLQKTYRTLSAKAGDFEGAARPRDAGPELLRAPAPDRSLNDGHPHLTLYSIY
jgi:uncharacterized protein YlxW (UPF0749 family)